MADNTDDGGARKNYKFNTNFDFGSLGSVLNDLSDGRPSSNNTYYSQIGNINKLKIGDKTSTHYHYASQPQNTSPNNNENWEADKLKQMIAIVSQKIDGKGSELAEKLGLQKFEIDDIREEHCGISSVNEALQNIAEAVLLRWQSYHEDNATCKNLVAALRLIKADEIINELEE